MVSRDVRVLADPPFTGVDVETAFSSLPDAAVAGLLALRALIFETARTTPGVGALEETLKWGQPAYLTPETKSGTTIRLGVPKEGGYALYVHCQTTLVADFQRRHPGEFTFEGTRALRFRAGEHPPLERVSELVRDALTYHLRRAK